MLERREKITTERTKVRGLKTRHQEKILNTSLLVRPTSDLRDKRL